MPERSAEMVESAALPRNERDVVDRWTALRPVLLPWNRLVGGSAASINTQVQLRGLSPADLGGWLEAWQGQPQVIGQMWRG